MSGEGEYGRRRTGNSPKLICPEPVPLPPSWRNEVNDLLWDMRLDIMCEIKIVITTTITSQIQKLAVPMATEIKAAIVADNFTEVTVTLTLILGEINEDLGPISQLPMVANDVSKKTSIEVDTDPRKRKDPTTSEEKLPPINVISTRLFRP